MHADRNPAFWTTLISSPEVYSSVSHSAGELNAPDEHYTNPMSFLDMQSTSTIMEDYTLNKPEGGGYAAVHSMWAQFNLEQKNMQ